MSRQGKKGKGPSKTPSRGYQTPKRNANSYGRQTQEGATPTPHTLRDEAQWVSSHRSGAFDSTKKLRHMPIEFVSAGLLQGTLEEQPPPDHTPAKEPASPSPPSPLDDNTLAQMTIRDPSPSPSSASSSSGEEVVFKGRGEVPCSPSPVVVKLSVGGYPIPPAEGEALSSENIAYNAAYNVAYNAVGRSPNVQPFTLPDRSLQAQKEQAQFMLSKNSTLSLRPGNSAAAAPAISSTAAPVRLSESAAAGGGIGAPASAQPKSTAKQQVASDGESDDSDTRSVIDAGFSLRRGDKPVWEGDRVEWDSRSKPNIGWLPVKDRGNKDVFMNSPANARDAALDDYQRNVEDFGFTEDLLAAAQASGFANREMDLEGGSHNDWEDQSILDEDDADEHDGWTSDQLRDFDDISTSDENTNRVVVRILLKRTRATGVQYLVTYEHEAVDDAHWLHASSLKSAAELDLAQKFEESHPELSSSDESNSEDDEEDEEDEEEDEDEELDDETMARVLQKQEELGLGSDELVLYAADQYFASPGSGRGSASYGHPKAGKQRRGRREPSFPSASAMADALAMDPYGGFDIMDTDRPSLRPKKKGRRGQLPPEIDDEDLNEVMQATWENDRKTKRLKKAEREELRKQGLLGRKGKAPDLGVRYKDGVDMDEITDEIREFMMSDMTTLSLPPMDAHYRAVIHQFIRPLNVNSKSRGDGVGRFTVLSKTRRTPPFSHRLFDNVFDNRFRARWARGGNQPGEKRRAPVPRAGGRPLRAQTGYKDGEVVGASAPELGPDNRGRALMEKMGWSKGMALGAVDNKGILQPIAHVVKTNKAGLQ